MPREAGDQLGPYRILAPLGAGGMGEVYKARDTRLDRSVAVKVLPEHIAQREDARARFEREARAVASLNHPNICTIHDIGPNYMVMELIDGETLADRIEKGPIPLEQAVRYAAQIADALDRAHRAGVTHRDVKPQNIMLTRDGVKVLDFGLAKSAPATSAPTEATLTKVLTTEGTVLGTPQYMAPEQFEGKEADARSDIWAFGAVLYELVTGQKAFQGKNYTSLVAAILGGEPAPMAVKPFTPAWLERLVRRCLQKDPEDRYQAMRDIVLDLQSPLTESSPAVLASSRASRLPWLVSALVTIVSVAGVYWRERSRELPHRKLEIVMPQMASDAAAPFGKRMDISPDGRRIAYINGGRLWVREMNELAGRELTGTEGAGDLFWSPDSSEIGYFVGTEMLRVAILGGAPKSICRFKASGRASAGAAWVTADTILFTGGTPESGDLYSVPANGGVPKVVVKRDPDSEETFREPSPLPDGRGAVFVIYRSSGSSALAVTDGSGTKVALGVEGPFIGHPVYSPSGHILFHQMYEPNGIWALPFSVSQRKATGEPFRAYPDAYMPSAGRDGTLVMNFRPAGHGGHLLWVDRNGKPLEKITGMQELSTFTLSPDGKRLALSGGARSASGIQTYDILRGTRSIVAKDGRNPVWSPSGDHLAFTTGGDSGSQFIGAPGSLVVEGLDGRSKREVYVSNEPIRADAPSYSPDGKYLLYALQTGSTKSALMYIPLKGDRKPVKLYESASRLFRPAFSPDGNYVVYLDAASGEVHLIRFPSSEGNWQVSANGTVWFKWSPKGDRLFYSQRRAIWEVEISSRPTVRLGAPRKLFDVPENTRSVLFDVSPDGNRFILNQSDEAPRSPAITVVENWFEEFRNRK